MCSLIYTNLSHLRIESLAYNYTYGIVVDALYASFIALYDLVLAIQTIDPIRFFYGNQGIGVLMRPYLVALMEGARVFGGL